MAEEIEGIDEVEYIDLTPKTYKPLPKTPEIPQEIKKQEIEKFNQNPITKQYGIKAVNSTFWRTYIIITSIAIFLLFLTNIIWFNIVFGQKDFSYQANVTINNEHQINPNIPVDVTNHINTTVIMPDEMILIIRNET